MDIEFPDWLSEQFLKQLLQKDEYQIEITNFNITRCVPKGSNFLSNVLRINIEFQKLLPSRHSEKEEISLIVKIPLNDDNLGALMNSGIVEREVDVYYELIPKLDEIFLTNHDKSLSPQCYKCNENGVLIMEDLIVSGYKMIVKREQMDFDHGMIVIKNMARFHAASVRLHENEPKLVENIGRHLLYKINMDSKVKSILDPVQGIKHLEMLCTEFEKWPETIKYVPFLSKLAPKFWDYFLPALDCYENEFVVLNHSDLHSGNIFFYYNEDNTIQDVKFIDFQMLRYTSPAMELIYFIHTSLKYEVIDKHYDELTQCYLNNLNLYLEKYGSPKRWKKDDFKKSLERRDIFTLLVCIVVLPFTFGASTDSLNNLGSHEYPYFGYSQSEKFRSTCVKFLEKYSNTLKMFE